MDRVLRIKDVMEILNCGRTKLWRMVQEGDFPRPRRISGGIKGWLASDVNAWLDSRPFVEGPDHRQARDPFMAASDANWQKMFRDTVREN